MQGRKRISAAAARGGLRRPAPLAGRGGTQRWGNSSAGIPALEQEITHTDSDCYGDGWLYRVRGTPDPASTDVDGYVALLNATIDRMVGRGDTETGETVTDD